jgi:signal transduction histidine kinase
LSSKPSNDKYLSAFNLMQRRVSVNTEEARACTEAQMELLLGFYERLSANYNSSIHDEPLKVSVQKVASEAAGLTLSTDRPLPTRIVVSTAFWSLSVRSYPAIIECYIVPSTELPTLPESELPSRMKLCLTLSDTEFGAWSLNGAVVNPEELHILLRGLLKDVTNRSRTDYESMPDQLRLMTAGHSFTGSVRSLLAEKHALMQKIVDQQEGIQSQLARELHDSVLGDVMLLQRSLSNAKRMPEEEFIAVLKEIANHLREICQELSPRDLKDCGLRAALEDLCASFSIRAGCQCQFVCPEELPDFSNEITLHVYRIAQESLNNAAKHASASNVIFQIRFENDCFTMSIADDGVGLEAMMHAQATRSSKDGGTGAGIIRERTELIGCMHPARVWFESPPGKGTKVTLEVLLS